MCNKLNERNELKDLTVVCKTVKSIFYLNRNGLKSIFNCFVVPERVSADGKIVVFRYIKPNFETNLYVKTYFYSYG